MKREEFTPCLRCRRPVGQANAILFYRVTLERMIFDHQAIQQTSGLELILHSPKLADVFAPDNELAKPLDKPEQFLLCDSCAMKSYPVSALEELAIDRRCSDAGDGEPTPAEVPAEAPADPPPGEAA